MCVICDNMCVIFGHICASPVVICVSNEVICLSSVAMFVLNVNLARVQCDLLCDRFKYKCGFTVVKLVSLSKSYI